MTQPTTPGTPDYTFGFSDEHVEQLSRSTAARSAAYLLPELKPGQRVLDFGCGPGSISVGLAQAIAPGGELYCVDMEESQVELARALAESQGLDNLRYYVADVTSLPFPDDYFDVAHGHDVLAYVPDTRTALAEVKRVLKPGGIIACRDMTCESCYTHPDLGIMRKSWDLTEDIIATDGGHPQMGKDLKGHLAEAGFVDIRVSGSFDMYATPEDVAFIRTFVHRWLLSPEMEATVLSYGAGTAELFTQLREGHDLWQAHPGAVCAIAFGEALGVKP